MSFHEALKLMIIENEFVGLTAEKRNIPVGVMSLKINEEFTVKAIWLLSIMSIKILN